MTGENKEIIEFSQTISKKIILHIYTDEIEDSFKNFKIKI